MTDLARREDAALLTGRAAFTDDHDERRLAHLAFVRSEHGHADLEAVDTAPAEALDGVLGAYTWADVDASDSPGRLPLSGLDEAIPAHPVLADGRVRYHGQPVAVVVAEDRYVARDAAEAVRVEYDPRPAVTDPREAVERADNPDVPTVFEAAPDNVAVSSELGDEEAVEAAFAAADRTVEVDLENNRLIPSALEPRAALARFDPDDGFHVTMTSQSPHGHRRKLAHTLGVTEGRIRVVSPHVGGGFGHKGHHHPGEAMAAWCARELGRPVKWTMTRSGNYLEGAHGRDHRTTAELAVDDDGTLRGLRAETYAAVGGYGLGGGAKMPGWYGRLLESQYTIDAVHCTTHAAFTTTAPVHSYRGAGRPEAVYVTERLVDIAADELDLDPAEIRRRNLIPPEDFPHETPVGSTYDTGDYEPAMDLALDAVDYEALRERSGEQRADGRYLGVGVANYVESTGGGFESGVVRVLPDGEVVVLAGTHSHGQGHGTTYARIVSEELGVHPDRIRVEEGDTAAIPTGTGTFGSRSTIVGGNAVAESARTVREKARKIAAHELGVELDADADTEDGLSDDDDGDFVGPNGEAVSFEAVASAAYGYGLPDDIDPGLDETTYYEPDGTTYSFGTHACVVAVDPETGEVEIERYVAVDDCGTRINQEIVEGQVHGGVAQGIGQARYEQVAYDEDGRLLTDTMDGYAVPRAGDLPEIETDHTVTPSSRNELGVKGIGEGGTIAAPPAVVNAVVDALSEFDIDHLDMPLTEERVWRAIRQ